MNEYYDVLQLLKRFGIFIYTGNKRQDSMVMESEVKELYERQFIDKQTYLQALLVLRREINAPDKKNKV